MISIINSTMCNVVQLYQQKLTSPISLVLRVIKKIFIIYLQKPNSQYNLCKVEKNRSVRGYLGSNGMNSVFHHKKKLTKSR